MKTTLVIGASENPDRYSYKAIVSLLAHNYPVIAFGKRSGEVLNIPIETAWDDKWQVDTVTLYVNPSLQQAMYNQILSLKPRRVIFNPGTENDAFCSLLKDQGVICENACTLVLLSIGQF